MTYPDSLSLDLARDDWSRVVIDFYNSGKLPPQRYQEISLPGSFVGRSIKLLEDLVPSRAQLVSGLEIELMAIFPRPHGYIVTNQSIRNPEFYCRVIPSLAERLAEKVLQELEVQFSCGGEHRCFPVYIGGMKLNTLTEAVLKYRMRIGNEGICISRNQVPPFNRLAEKGWNIF